MSLLLTACGRRAATHKEIHTPVSLLDADGTQKLVALIENYYKLKDALVADDVAMADEHTMHLVTAANNLTTGDSMVSVTLQARKDTLINACKAMLEAKNENIEVKRIYFRQVSDAVYAISAAAKLSNAGVYRQYCPMAFNDEGAYWLSNSREIQNPYFGRKMEECGEVTDSL
jgi:hypothetical protein